MLAVVLAGVVALPAARAATIRLENGTSVEGDVLQADDDSVIIGLPRARVATINGHRLPPVLSADALAPAFTATDVSGQTRTVGAGSAKMTVLHFWVHWCPHCRSDATQLQALHDRFRDDPRAQVLSVNLDDASARAKVEQFIREHHVTYPVIVAAEQKDVDLPQLYQVNGFPLTYLIDDHGLIRKKVSGSFVESHVDVGALLADLLSASTGAAATAASR